MGVVCDDEEIQRTLPHIVVVNEHMRTAEVYLRLAPQLPDCVQLWKRKSSWLNVDAMCDVVKALGECLEPYRDTHQSILRLDACQVHLNAKVWRAAKNWNMLMFVYQQQLRIACNL